MNDIVAAPSHGAAVPPEACPEFSKDAAQVTEAWGNRSCK